MGHHYRATVAIWHTHTHTRLTALFPGLPRWAGTRKGKPIWILLKHETVSGSGISWAMCKSAPRSRQTTTPAPHHSVFYRPDALPAAQPTASKHWRQCCYMTWQKINFTALVKRVAQTGDFSWQISCGSNSGCIWLLRTTVSNSIPWRCEIHRLFIITGLGHRHPPGSNSHRTAITASGGRPITGKCTWFTSWLTVGRTKRSR